MQTLFTNNILLLLIAVALAGSAKFTDAAPVPEIPAPKQSLEQLPGVSIRGVAVKEPGAMTALDFTVRGDWDHKLASNMLIVGGYEVIDVDLVHKPDLRITVVRDPSPIGPSEAAQLVDSIARLLQLKPDRVKLQSSEELASDLRDTIPLEEFEDPLESDLNELNEPLLSEGPLDGVDMGIHEEEQDGLEAYVPTPKIPASHTTTDLGDQASEDHELENDELAEDEELEATPKKSEIDMPEASKLGLPEDRLPRLDLRMAQPLRIKTMRISKT